MVPSYWYGALSGHGLWLIHFFISGPKMTWSGAGTRYIFVRLTSFPGMQCFQVEWIMEWRCKDQAVKRWRWSAVSQLEQWTHRRKVRDRRCTHAEGCSGEGGWPEGLPCRRQLWRRSGGLKGLGLEMSAHNCSDSTWNQSLCSLWGPGHRSGPWPY